MKKLIFIGTMLLAPVAVQADGWFPKLSPNGQVASGSREVYIENRATGQQGIAPQWFKKGLLVKGLDDKPYYVDLSSGARTLLENKQYVTISAGGDQWLGAVGSTIATSVSRQGLKAWLVEHNGNNNDHTLYLNGTQIVRGSVHNPRVEDGAITWLTAVGGRTRQVWGKLPNGSAMLLRDDPLWQGAAVPVLTANGERWVVSQTNWDLRAYQWGTSSGYIIPTGEDNNLHPDALGGKGTITVVANTTRGELRRYVLSLSAPRVNTNAATAPAPNPTPTPKPEPEPEPEPQDKVDGDKARAIVNAERAKFPTDRSLREAEIVQLLRNIAAELNRQKLSEETFGILVKTSGSQCAGYSCDIICTGQDDKQRQWDVLGDADPAESEHPGKQTPGWSGPLSTIAVRQCEEVPAGGGTEPEPEPEPQPTPDLEALRQQVTDLQKIIAALGEKFAALESEVNKLIDAGGGINEEAVRNIIRTFRAKGLVSGFLRADLELKEQ